MSITSSRCVALALWVGACALGLSAHANGNSGARKPPTKVTFHKSTAEESPQARDKRLTRECKGRPNAGMCAGFTR